MEFLLFLIYILIGVLLAESKSNLEIEISVKSFLFALKIVLFWPLILAVGFIELVDEVKKDRGI